MTAACGPRHGRGGAAGAPLGPNARTDRLPRGQDRGRVPAGLGRARARFRFRARNGGAGGLARSLSVEPDADQWIDEPVRPRRPAARE